MAKTSKAELLEQAKELGLGVTEKNTVAEITEAIEQNQEPEDQNQESRVKSQEKDSEDVTHDSGDKVAPAKAGDSPTKPLAKSGKRSAKAIAEAEEKEAKASRKAAQSSEASAKEESKKQPAKPARSRLERRGKNYRKLAEQLEKGKVYGLKEAAELAVKTSPVKFDATVELHVRLNVDPKQADQNVRATVGLPAGTGKNVRIAVLAGPEDAEKAKKAGADIAGEDEITAMLDKESLDFDVLIATPAMMPKLGKYARLLGPKGLMPNPKSGTVAADTAKAVQKAKAGRVEFRVDSTGIIHVATGKVSFGAEKLTQNLGAILAAIKNHKPASIKGNYVRSIYVTTSMGPSISIETSAI